MPLKPVIFKDGIICAADRIVKAHNFSAHHYRIAFFLPWRRACSIGGEINTGEGGIPPDDKSTRLRVFLNEPSL